MIANFPTPQLQWQIVHTFGSFEPVIDARATDGARLFIVPHFTDNLVVINFNRPTSGTATLTEPGSGTGSTIPVTKPVLGAPTKPRLR